MKNIALVITDLSSGGAERVMSILANYLSYKGYSIEIVMLQDDKVDYFIEKNIEITVINKFKSNRIIRFVYRLYALHKILKKKDIAIAFLWHINLYTIVASFGLKCKVIISDRNDPKNELKNMHKLVVYIKNNLYKVADYVVFQTKYAQMYYSEKVIQKSSIILNPILPNLKEYRSCHKKNKVVSVCRLSEQKNITMSIDAFEEFQAEYPDYCFEIYGKGELLNELSSYVEQKNLISKIFFKGFSDNVCVEIADANIYLSSSNYEGISNSMLEAMGLGIPVVVTDCPVWGAQVIIEDGINGFIVPVCDHKAMANKMKLLARDPILSKKISENALKISERLGIDNIGRDWENIINKVLGNKL